MNEILKKEVDYISNNITSIPNEIILFGIDKNLDLITYKIDLLMKLISI